MSEWEPDWSYVDPLEQRLAETVVRQYREQLTAAGYVVTWADDLREALDCLRGQSAYPSDVVDRLYACLPDQP